MAAGLGWSDCVCACPGLWCLIYIPNWDGGSQVDFWGEKKNRAWRGLNDGEEKMLPENVSRSGDNGLVPSVSFPQSECFCRALPHSFIGRNF